MKKILALVLVLAMVAALFVGCQSNENTSEQPAQTGEVALGRYEAITMSVEGKIFRAGELIEGGLVLELKPDGVVTVSSEGESVDGNWTCEKDVFTLIDVDGEVSGTLTDGILRFTDFGGTGSDLVLVNREAADPAAVEALLAEAISLSDLVGEAGQTASEEAYDPDWWAGKWYGWRVNYLARGAYADYEDYYWDVCGEISVDGDRVDLKIWDYEEEPEDLFLNIRFRLEDGVLSSESGMLLDMPVGPGDVVVDPSDTEVSSLDHMLFLDLYYESPDNGEDWTNILMYLRPWGMDWEDARTADTSDMSYDDLMPRFYEDWYLPQINGEAAG